VREIARPAYWQLGPAILSYTNAPSIPANALLKRVNAPTILRFSAVFFGQSLDEMKNQKLNEYSNGNRRIHS